MKQGKNIRNETACYPGYPSLPLNTLARFSVKTTDTMKFIILKYISLNKDQSAYYANPAQPGRLLVLPNIVS